MIKKINNTFYVRYKVPVDLVAIFGTKEILKSLYTIKKTYATILHDIYISKIQELNLLARFGMIPKDKLKALFNNFKTKKVNDIIKQINSHPNPKKTILHELDLYEEEKERYKRCNYTNDYSIVEDDAKDILNNSQYKSSSYDDTDINYLSKELVI